MSSKKNKEVEQTTFPAEMDFSYFSPLEVKIYNNFDKAMKVFRSLVQSDGILSLYKEKQSYEKPSDKKRRKKNESIQRNLENEVKQKKILSGEYEKEKVKKQIKKEQRKRERDVERSKAQDSKE